LNGPIDIGLNTAIFLQMKLSLAFVWFLIAAALLGFVASERSVDPSLGIDAGVDAQQVPSCSVTGY
jgi:hypothetical protein